MQKDNYFDFLLNNFGTESGQRQYTLKGAYDEIEVVRGKKYYIYNEETSIFLGHYGRELLKICTGRRYESDLINLMKETYKECEQEILLLQIYFNLAQLIDRGFIRYEVEGDNK